MRRNSIWKRVSLILIIDDAHELSAEVLQLLTKLLDSSVDSSIHALLFGENQIDSLLQRILTADEQERLAIFSARWICQ